MKKISGSTFYFKRVFPTMWFLGVTTFAVFGLVGPQRTASPVAVVMPIVMTVLLMAIGYVVFKRLVWDLADEVYDTGEGLLFRRRGQEQRVGLRDIVNISSSAGQSPARVVVTVRSPGALGKELAFRPPTHFDPFSTHPLVQELIERVDRARRR